jgi:adenylate kinase family enzyme
MSEIFLRKVEEPMAKMYLMCGCSGAGKTTFSKAFAKKHVFLEVYHLKIYEA